MWIQGSVEGAQIRRALKTNSWERAEALRHQMEDAAKPTTQKLPITLQEAFTDFLADCRSRNLRPATLNKHRQIERQLLAFARHHGYHTLAQFDASATRAFRNSWKLGPLTAAKQLERLRAFFRYCVDSDLMEKNPARAIKPPIFKQSPRAPFSEAEQAKLVLWFNHPVWNAPTGKKNILPPHPKTATFLKLLYFTALRIGDAAMLRKDRVQNGELLLYAAKNGKPVWLPLPPDLVKELQAIPGPNFFPSPQGSQCAETVSDYWRDQIVKVFDYLEIKGTPHRFRHTLAIRMLNAGSSMEDVAAVLGNSPGIVAKHYSPWVQSRQNRISDQIQKTWLQPVLLSRAK
jgi:integrase/recombinase XerD